MSSDTFRGVKAVLKTALTWGIALGALGGSLVGLWVLFDAGPGVESLHERVGEALFAGVAMGVRFGIAGAILGTLFATMLRLGFRGRRVAELHPGRFALIGAVVGGVGIPLVYQLLNILSGDGPVLWKYLIDDIPWAATAGALGAAGTVWMARRAAALPDERERARLGEGNAFEDPAALEEQPPVPRPGDAREP